VPVDLSQVLFICTSNSLETISAPLLDRCEIIQLSGMQILLLPFNILTPFPAGYTYDEKMHIARRFLVPKQLNANGLDSDRLDLTEPALLQITTRYTREAGVRSLERSIGAVVRAKAVEWADHADERTENEYRPEVRPEDLEHMLGIARWDDEERNRDERRGIVYGLVVMGQGEGGILPVETIATPGTGQLKLTGSLGEVSFSFRSWSWSGILTNIP
jgi:ATP-dependent Lon protease